MHIPRTGGGSVKTAIAFNYGRPKSAGNVQKDPDRTAAVLEKVGRRGGKRDVRAVVDHIPYGLYARHLPPDTRYITILRDPVERVISHYRFLHRNDQARPEIWTRLAELDQLERRRLGAPGGIDLDGIAELSLEEGLARRLTIFDNLATRFLYGGESIFGDLPPDAADRALANLERFALVGVTERLDESIVLLGRMLGVGLMSYRFKHASLTSPARDAVPDPLRARIAEQNASDLKLYRAIRERFDAAAASVPSLEADAEELRRLCRDAAGEHEEHEERNLDQKVLRRLYRRSVRRR